MVEMSKLTGRFFFTVICTFYGVALRFCAISAFVGCEHRFCGVGAVFHQMAHIATSFCAESTAFSRSSSPKAAVK